MCAGARARALLAAIRMHLSCRAAIWLGKASWGQPSFWETASREVSRCREVLASHMFAQYSTNAD
eukprot:14380428-Alexandrium_andersonii.AAC.1